MRKTKKTNEEFIIELQEKNPNIKPLEEYKGALKKIRVECKNMRISMGDNSKLFN